MKLFGFEIRRDQDDEQELEQAFTPPVDTEGAIVVADGGAYGTYIDIENQAKDDVALIENYRAMARHAEVAQAIEDICNDAIVISDDEASVSIVTDDLDLPDSIKKRISEEYDYILDLVDFRLRGYDLFRQWYIDGRMYHHVIIDENKTIDGIKDLRQLDPRKVRKFKHTKQDTNRHGYPVTRTKGEYFLYNERGFTANSTAYVTGTINDYKGLRIAPDSIIYSTSGIVNERNTTVLSHLDKAVKPYNQLSMLEDASVIYRISRAPERRVFYIDVGRLPKIKAEQYLREMMTKHKNRTVYDASTGNVRNDRRHMTMLEDFWLPRREGGKGTQIETLPGGQNLGEMDDVMYFQKKLYAALNVPTSRLDPDNPFVMGRSGEISRDELKFARFIERLRGKFAHEFFGKILERQLVLKNIIRPEEWMDIRSKLRYDYREDSHFEEMKDSEIMQGRMNILRDAAEYEGKYYSREFIRKKLLRQTDDDIKEIDDQISKEIKDGTINDPNEEDEDGGSFRR